MTTNLVRENPNPSEDRTRALLELLYHVSREVATALDLRTVLQRVLYASIENVGGERGSIVVLDDSGKAVDATIVHGQKVHDHTTQQLRDTVERGLAGWVVRNRKPALVPDTSKDERWLLRPYDAIEKTGAKSAICVPLLARERLVGVLTLVHSKPNEFGPEHLELMQAIADQAGIAVLNARLYTESQRQTRVMSALAESAAAINTSLRLEEVLPRILNQTIQALQVETVALALTDPASGDLVYRAATGHNAGNILDRRIPVGEGLTGQIVKSGRGVIVLDVRSEKRFREVDKFGGIDMRAVALAPIQSPGEVIGVLEAINPVTGVFDQDAMLVMMGLGGLAGTSIQNAQLFERLEAAHQRYRELFEESIDPIIITNSDGKIIEANRQAVHLSGYSDDELHAMTIEKLHKVNWAKTGQNFENLKNYRTCSYDSSLHQVDGHTLPIQVSVRPVEFEESEALQWTMHDITERKALDDLRNDLISMVYHDLRSPLSNIISSLDILGTLVNSKENDSVESILGIAINSTTRIERLVNSLLDINRLESGQKIIDQQKADLASMIFESVKDVLPVAESRKQVIKTQVAANVPFVWVDEDMIRRVLINLLENATKFTPLDGQIEIGARMEGAWVCVWVYDNGPGISIKDQEHIFDKFTRLRGNDKQGGLGIGLAFCRLAVEGHGGRIWIESNTEKKGTTFFFTLPVAKLELQPHVEN